MKELKHEIKKTVNQKSEKNYKITTGNEKSKSGRKKG
jgi:hypothetical protein